MRNADTEAAARLDDPGGLVDGAGHVVDIHERVEPDNEVEAPVVEGEGGGVTDHVLPGGICLASKADHRRRRVDPDDVMPAALQVARDASFTATQVERLSTRARKELEERRTGFVPI
jgi:hypothetical protein